MLFSSLVRSNLECCRQVRTPQYVAHIKHIERIQKIFMLYLSYQTHNAKSCLAAYEECVRYFNLMSLRNRRLLLDHKYKNWYQDRQWSRGLSFSVNTWKIWECILWYFSSLYFDNYFKVNDCFSLMQLNSIIFIPSTSILLLQYPQLHTKANFSYGRI